MTHAENVARALRWRLSPQSMGIAVDRMNQLINEGHLFTPEERHDLADIQAQLSDGTSWSDLWLAHITMMLIRDAPARLQGPLKEGAAATAFAIVDRPGTSVSIGTYEDGSHLLLMDRGITFLLTALFGPLAYGWPTKSEPADASATDRLRIEFRLEVAARRFLADAEGGLIHYRQNPDRSSLVSYLMGRAMLFGVAHELGHVLLGHTGAEHRFMAGTDVASATDDVDTELAADEFAVSVAFGRLDDRVNTDVLFVDLCAARGLMTVLAALEAEVYARPARSHPPALLRWQHVADRVIGAGHGPTVDQLERFWESRGLHDLWATPLTSPDELLGHLQAAEGIDHETLPDMVCGLVALADRHFVLPDVNHQAVVTKAHDDLVHRATRAIDALFTAHPNAGLSWQSLFTAVEPAYTIVPHPATLSAARLAWFGIPQPL